MASEKSPLLETKGDEPKLTRARMLLRWVVLPLSCLLMIGNYYCYDNPSALNIQLKQYFASTAYGGDNWQTYFALFYTVYSIPNTVLPFFGGFFVDYFGVRIMLIIFASFITAGQALFAFGASLKSVPVMLAGRVLFGFGGENLTVAQSALIAVWFKDKELAFALGLNLSIARLGGVINNILSPMFWSSNHMSLWVGVMICGASLGCCILLVPIDKLAERRILKSNPDAAFIKIDEKISLKDARHFNAGFWLLTASCVIVYGCVLPFNNVASGFLVRRNYLKSGSWTGNRTFVAPENCDTSCDSDYSTIGACNNASFTDGCTWINATAAPQASPAHCDSTDYCNALNDAEDSANTAMSIPYIISAVISPFLGYAVDRFGGRAVLATAAPAVLIAVHITLGYSDVTPYAPLVGQGLAYSVFAASLWPSVPYVVKSAYIGTAYGLMTAVQNAGMASFPLIVAQILNPCNNDPATSDDAIMDRTTFDNCEKSIVNYKYTESFFAGLAVIGVLVGIMLNVFDRRNGSPLNKRHVDKLDEKALVLNASE